MAHPRTFRFGIQMHASPDGASWAAAARKAEDLGFSTLFLPDHFGDQLAPVPAMAAAAAVTTDLRIGCLVFDNDYRHPVVLGKDIATLDLLSGGRVEFGLGAGWMNTDYEQSGIPHDPAGRRIDRMEEAIHVYKGIFGPDTFDYQGDHYTITGLNGLPKPVQQPHPPLLIGGGGKRVLSIAGREADIVGINPSIVSGQVDAAAARSGAPELTDQKVQWVKEAAGDRFDDLELNALIFAAIITDDRDGTIANMAPLFDLEPAGLEHYPHAVVGSVEQICDSLQERRERWGISYITFQNESIDAMAPVVAALAGT